MISINIKNPLILAIDTTSSRLSIVLAKGTSMLAQWGLVKSKQGASEVLLNISQILESSQISIKEIDVFGILIGPGSFTGIRVGLATIQGIAQPLKTPIVTATTFEILAENVPQLNEKSYICTAQVAHREEIYFQIFKQQSGKQSPLIFGSPSACSIKDFITLLPEIIETAKKENSTLILTGDAISNFANLFDLEQNNISNFIESAEGWKYFPEQTFLSQAALPLFLKRWNEGKGQPVQNIQPYYVRASDTEIKEKFHKTKK